MFMRYSLRFYSHCAFIISLFVLLTVPASGGASGIASVPLDELESRMWVKPFMEVLPDAGGSLTITQVASPRMRQQFRHFDDVSPLGGARAVWLRLTLLDDGNRNAAALPPFRADKAQPLPDSVRFALSSVERDGQNSTAEEPQETPEPRHALLQGPVLQLGPTIPAPVELYIPSADSAEGWQRIMTTGTAVPLPAPGGAPLTVYLRIAGAPGPWFQPTLHPAGDSLDDAVRAAKPMHLLQGALLALILLHIAMAATAKSVWRLWAAAATAAVLLHSLSPVAAATLFSWRSVAALFLPGIAVLVLAQTGRSLLRTDESQRADRLFALCMAAGAIAALLPLIPGFSGLHRALPLWPLLCVLPALPALLRWQDGVSGAGRYMLACLLPATGTVAGMGAALSPDAPYWASLGPALGTAGGLLCLAIAPDSKRCVPAAAPEQNDTAEQHAFEQQEPHLTAGALLARVSHDLRTPLTAMLSTIEELTASLPVHTGRKQLALLQSAGRNLQLQINDLLDAARAAKGRTDLKAVRFNLHHVLEEAHDIALIKAGRKGLQLSWFMSPHLPVNFLGDPDRILQIVLNLLGNAIRFTDEGTIRLSVERVDDSTDPGHLRFTISDTGVGIPLENPYAVFDSFCVSPGTGSGRYGGMGLGLSITRDLVSMMGGVVCLESAPASGTTVSFTLRLQPASKLPHGMPSCLGRQPGLVLVADDIASNRQLLSFFLEDTPLVLIEARSGAEALRVFRRRLPSLVMVDARMPEMSGPETVRALREAETELGLMPGPVFGVVKAGDEQGAEAMRQAGCSAILLRPFTRGTLLSAVSETIAAMENPAQEPATAPECAVPASGHTAAHTAQTMQQADITGGQQAHHETAEEPAEPEPLLSAVNPMFFHNEERKLQNGAATVEQPETCSGPEADGCATEHAASAAENTETDSVAAQQTAAAMPHEQSVAPVDTPSLEHFETSRSVKTTEVDTAAQKSHELAGTAEDDPADEESPLPDDDGDAMPPVNIPSVLTPETFARISAAVAALAEPEPAAPAGLAREEKPYRDTDGAEKAGVFSVMKPQAEQAAEQHDTAGIRQYAADAEPPAELPAQLQGLSDSISAGRRAMLHNDLPRTGAAAAAIEHIAAQLGLQALRRIARCVCDAAAANDADAVQDLFAELESATVRNRKAMEDLFRMQTVLRQNGKQGTGQP
jgi:signal transduction histidine kinase/CheY-like chemotaxis protein